jgi:AAA ATPase domain
MLRELSIKNFKPWRDTGKIRLAPITVFFGGNSSGKTSILQFLLMLRQTAESPDRHRVFHPGDDNTQVKLGTFRDLIFGHDLSREMVHRVSITPMDRPPRLFEQFPEHDALQTFDPSDQKFVAVANAHPDKPPILQATDSKWWGWKDALRECGIIVEFLCQDEIQQTYERKFRASQE